MEGLKRNIVIMDFSGIYQEEQFYEGEQISWIELSDISGTNCYCDGDAQTQILERMEKYPVSGIYFIDSGNYHYMSRIGIGRVKEPSTCWYLTIIQTCSFLLSEGFCPAGGGLQVHWKR